MNIPFVDLKEQYQNIKSEIMNCIEAVLDDGDFIMGKFEREFAENFCKLQGSKYAVGCSNGTNAITAALRALKIGIGDEVITQANSFFATVEAIVEVGATPVFVDCDPETYSINVNQIKEKISNKTKAIIPVHLYGNPAPMKEVMVIASDHNLKVIEDCAQAHLAHIDGKHCGTWGDIGTFSFYPGKNLGAYGDAGAVITQSEELFKRLQMEVNHGRVEKYSHDFCASNFRMDAIQAAILNVKMKYITKWTDQRREIAKLYDSLLSNTSIKTMKVRDDAFAVYHLYPVEVPERDRVQLKLKEAGISTGIHYPIPLHKQPALTQYSSESYPISEKSSKSMLSLPLYPEMPHEYVHEVVRNIQLICS